MDPTELEGIELPSGEYTVERWKAFLWADATRNDDDTFRYDDDAIEAGENGQLVPHTLCQHIAFEATGGIESTMGRLADDWTSGAALGQLRATFHGPLEVGQTVHVEGHIANVERKEGSSGGLTIVTHAYDVRTPDDEPIYEMEADMILMEGA
ncbi:MaoC family dehydratase N-terminal domain-containing protein [Halobacteria archaeon AArc-curdl1]|uniref:MaoC family dehydratase N-terminal domain-containing protein n=1 Tax=Natronosalvus hydrolyticus TaxID=2979988 RepID=A0AAP2Z9D0_9EURY|nr:MaoC family dehydratase N-terminal domain-containing protein [Halobacteria archaeon AArc-curdl1]